MKSKIKKIMPILIFLILIIYYFEYSVTILWDSAHYMSYVNIFERLLPFYTWDVVRGPVFPIIIFFGNLFFGKSAQGLTLNTFIYYIVMLLFAYKLLKYSVSKIYVNDRIKKIYILVTMIFIIINPIIFGFYHSLLTEFVAITLSIISCYIAVLWLDTDCINNKRKYIFLSFIFVLFTILSWFLKQPYVSCGLFPLIISYIISIFQDKNIKKIALRTSAVLLSIICLVLSIKLWNAFLTRMGANPDTDRNPTVSLGNTLIASLGFTKINSKDIIRDKSYIKENDTLSSKEKQELFTLMVENKDYVLIEVYNDNDIVDTDYVLADKGNIGSIEAFKYILGRFFKNPVKILDAYVTNYLSIIDIYSTNTADSVTYESTGEFDLNFSNEILSISTKPYHFGEKNIYYMLPEMEERIENYKQDNYGFKPLNYVMLILSKVYLVAFKFSFVLLPFVFVLVIILRIVHRKKKNMIHNLNCCIILSGYSLLHILVHTVTGAIIDRYAIPAFISTDLAIIILIMALITRNNKIKNKSLKLKSY